MRHFLPILAALAVGAAWGQDPAYSAANFANSSDYSPGPFAPNSVLSLFGTNLSWVTAALAPGDIFAATLPTQLGNVEVIEDGYPVSLLYVSPSQINFIVRGTEIAGAITVHVVRESSSGPEVTLILVDAAPALFAQSTGYVVATHADGSPIAADSPAHAGDTVVVYATGLGKTTPNPAPGEIPQTAAQIVSPGSLTVYLDGAALDPVWIKYAGLTPLSIGLYQINIQLPPNPGTDPEIRVDVGTQESQAGLKIAVR